MRPFLAIIALAATFASPSFAATVAEMDGDDEVIATAHAKPTAEALTATATQAAAPTATTPARPLTTQEQVDAFIGASAPVEAGPRGLLPADRDEDGKRKVHGSVSAAVGTGGYRSFSASALFPVGETTTVGVAVSKTDCGKRGGCYYGGPYGDGYGYGYGAGYGPGYGYGRGYGRGGERQSIALSVMTGDRQRADTPEGCAPGFRADGRYVEPLWVEGMRDGAHPCTAASPSR